MAFDQQRFGKYRLLRRIAAGGMGEVHLAKLVGPSGFEKLVVIKRLLEARRADSKYVEMFFSEARVAAQLTHSNIAQIYETGEVEGVPYIAMEYVHGKSLRKILDQAEAHAERSGSPRVPTAFVGSIVAQLCRGLSFAHDAHHLSGAAMGLIHRDINPLNVLVSYQGEVKIIDFGIAKSELNIDKTQAGTIKGTVVYMSPEQSLGRALDKRSDLFSVGICLYEALSGKNPFHKGTLGASLDAIRRALVPPLADPSRPELRAFAGILSQVLQSRPEERYADCGQLADALEAVLSSGQLTRPAENLATYLRRLFADDMREEERSLERTDSASLDELEAVSPARGAGTAVLPERRAETVEGVLDGERTSGGRPVAQVSSVHAHLQGMRAATGSPAPLPHAAQTDPVNESMSLPLSPAAQPAPALPSDSAIDIVLDAPDFAEQSGSAPGWVRRLTDRAPGLSGWLLWDRLVPGRFGGRFGLPVALCGLVLALGGGLALWAGRQSTTEEPAEAAPLAHAGPPRPVRRTAAGREVPSFLEGEIDEATQTPLKHYKEDNFGLHLLEDAPLTGGSPEAQSAPTPTPRPAPAAPPAATSRRWPAAAGRHRTPTQAQARSIARAIRAPVKSNAATPTLRLRADPPLAMRHNGDISQNPVRLHDGRGLLELRGGPGGKTFVIRVQYQSVHRDVTFSIDSEPWADVFGAGGISLGRTPVRIQHAGDSTALVFKNPRFHGPQHVTLKLSGQAAVSEE